MRRQGGHSQMHMAEVVLKNLKKVYPNTEKKKKKGEPEKKNDLQITDEGVVAVQDFNLRHCRQGVHRAGGSLRLR